MKFNIFILVTAVSATLICNNLTAQSPSDFKYDDQGQRIIYLKENHDNIHIRKSGGRIDVLDALGCNRPNMEIKSLSLVGHGDSDGPSPTLEVFINGKYVDSFLLTNSYIAAEVPVHRRLKKDLNSLELRIDGAAVINQITLVIGDIGETDIPNQPSTAQSQKIYKPATLKCLMQSGDTKLEKSYSGDLVVNPLQDHKWWTSFPTTEALSIASNKVQLNVMAMDYKARGQTFKLGVIVDDGNAETTVTLLNKEDALKSKKAVVFNQVGNKILEVQCEIMADVEKK
jgi:hypothetical protein